MIICVKRLTILTPIISLVYSTSTLLEIEEPYLPAEKATNYELGACYNVTVECRVSPRKEKKEKLRDLSILVHTDMTRNSFYKCFILL